MLVHALWQAAPQFVHADFAFWMNAVLLVVLTLLCRMMPVHFGGIYTVDLSLTPILACAFGIHSWASVILLAVSNLLVIRRDKETGRYSWFPDNIPMLEIFRQNSMLLSLGLTSLMYSLVDTKPLQLLSVRTVVLCFGFALIFMLFSLALEHIYLSLGSIRRKSSWQIDAESLSQTMFVALCVTPFALVLALVLQLENGYFYLILLLAPMLMARHALKLYTEGREMNLRTIAALSHAIEAKDTYTQGHSTRVAYYSEQIARSMHKSQRFVEEVRMAALLHDVGKIGINDALLLKKGALTPEEYEEIKRHAEIGYNIIRNVQFSRTVNEAVLYHHLRYDGMGYPLVEPLPSKLPPAAAILAVADTFDAMISDRPYRDGMPVEKAVEVLEEVAGTQLDPQVVRVFLRILPSLDLEPLVNEEELLLPLVIDE